MAASQEFDRRAILAAGGLALLPAQVLAIARGEGAWSKLLTVPYRGKQDDIAFGSAARGWYGNGQGLLYRTDDGGDSWREVWRRPGTFVRALGFLDERTGILGNVGVGSFPDVSDRTPLYRTVDGGESWAPVTAIEGPMPEGICAIDVVRTTMIDRGRPATREIVHAAGRVGAPAHYLQSVDRGESWTSKDLSQLTAALFDVKFRDHRTGFLAGTSDADLKLARGLILRTDDGGRTWREVYRSTRPMETVWKLHFPSGSIGYASVQSYDAETAQRFLAKTEDGGATWTELPLVNDRAWRSFGIGFATSSLGWVGGTTGGLETRDGGRTWAPAMIGKAVNKFRFVDAGRARRVYAIGSEIHRLDL